MAASALALAALAAGGIVRGQVYAEGGMEAYEAEFYFARLAYPGYGGRFRGGWGAWTTDFPEAEIHLTQGVTRLTRVEMAREGRIINLDDEELMKYPWLYAVEVGNWVLGEREAALLREYLLRGGFLMVDDFHGEREWALFYDSMLRVFPDRPVIEIPEDDELMHVLYDLNKDIQIPGAGSIYSGVTYEKGGVTPHWRGIYDDAGRLMVAINFNMDLGDAWEHADDPYYPEPMTGLAYRFGVNYVIYSLTH